MATNEHIVFLVFYLCIVWACIVQWRLSCRPSLSCIAALMIDNSPWAHCCLFVCMYVCFCFVDASLTSSGVWALNEKHSCPRALGKFATLVVAVLWCYSESSLLLLQSELLTFVLFITSLSFTNGVVHVRILLKRWFRYSGHMKQYLFRWYAGHVKQYFFW